MYKRSTHLLDYHELLFPYRDVKNSTDSRVKDLYISSLEAVKMSLFVFKLIQCLHETRDKHRRESAEVVHVVRMPPERRPRGRTRTHWRGYISHLAWERLWFSQEELESVAGEKDVWVSLLDPLPSRPDLR